MGGRALTYPLAAIIVPLGWWRWGRGKGGRYLWELGEYFTFIRGGPEERTASTDTLGDLGGGLTGSTLAALLTVTLLWRFQKELGTNRFR